MSKEKRLELVPTACNGIQFKLAKVLSRQNTKKWLDFHAGHVVHGKVSSALLDSSDVDKPNDEETNAPNNPP